MEELKNYNVIKDNDELNQLVESEISEAVDCDKIDIVFDPKIFMHNDEERRVTYEHIRQFYEGTVKKKLHREDLIYYFGHALRGKGEEVYNSPVEKSINFVKREVFKQINLKDLGPHHGKKVKILKKLATDRYLDIFDRAHFGIVPISEVRLETLCEEYKVQRNKLHYNPVSGMLSNACMSENCRFFMQPMEHAQFSNHMRLWRKTLPTRFHIEVVQLARQKQSVEQIYAYLIGSGHVNLKKHRKSKE